MHTMGVRISINNNGELGKVSSSSVSGVLGAFIFCDGSSLIG